MATEASKLRLGQQVEKLGFSLRDLHVHTETASSASCRDTVEGGGGGAAESPRERLFNAMHRWRSEMKQNLLDPEKIIKCCYEVKYSIASLEVPLRDYGYQAAQDEISVWVAFIEKYPEGYPRGGIEVLELLQTKCNDDFHAMQNILGHDEKLTRASLSTAEKFHASSKVYVDFLQHLQQRASKIPNWDKATNLNINGLRDRCDIAQGIIEKLKKTLAQEELEALLASSEEPVENLYQEISDRGDEFLKKEKEIQSQTAIEPSAILARYQKLKSLFEEEKKIYLEIDERFQKTHREAFVDSSGEVISKSSSEEDLREWSSMLTSCMSNIDSRHIRALGELKAKALQILCSKRDEKRAALQGGGGGSPRRKHEQITEGFLENYRRELSVLQSLKVYMDALVKEEWFTSMIPDASERSNFYQKAMGQSNETLTHYLECVEALGVTE